MTRVVAVCGSRSEQSYTRAALRCALDAAAAAGAETDMVDLGAVDLPLYHPDVDDEEQGDAVALKRRVRLADGVLVGSPVYHGSYSSTFKNFHDFCGYDEYEDTVVGLLAVAGGGSFEGTLEHLRATVLGVHGTVVPQQVGIRNGSDRFERRDGRPVLADGDVRDRTEELARRVVGDAGRLFGSR